MKNRKTGTEELCRHAASHAVRVGRIMPVNVVALHIVYAGKNTKSELISRVREFREDAIDRLSPRLGRFSDEFAADDIADLTSRLAEIRMFLDSARNE